MVLKEKLKYLIPGVFGTLLVGALAILLLLKLSGKDSAATPTDEQTKEELREPVVDPCVTLLEEFVRATDAGVDREKLMTLYAKGSAQCPEDFPLPQDELPKLEVVRAHLVKRQEEKKREGGVNTAEKAEQGGATSATLRSKGSSSAADPSKPATVPQAKNSTTEIKNKTDQTSAKSDDEASTSSNKPLPSSKELKKERAKAKGECMKMLHDMITLGKQGNLVDAFTEEQRKRIQSLVKEGLIPNTYNERVLVDQFWLKKMLMFIKTGKTKEAQDTSEQAVQSLGQQPGATAVNMTDSDEYKFWAAIAIGDWVEATNLFDKAAAFLPSHVRDTMKKNPEKLKLLRELDDAQMDALFEYCSWNEYLEECQSQYSFAEEDDWKARYEKVAENMTLLMEDIHKDFDFALPALQGKKSLLQKLDEKLTNKTPEFEAAFKKLREDESLGMSLVVDALKALEEPKDRVALLEAVKESKSGNEADLSLTEVLISAVKRKPIELDIQISLDEADFTNVQQLANIYEALKWIKSCGGDPFQLACLDFWMLFVALVQSLTTRFNEPTDVHGTLGKDLHCMSMIISPSSIHVLGESLSRSKIGAEGTPLVEQCALCMQKNMELNPGNDKFKVAHEFVQGYLKIYKAANGANMEGKIDQINALWQQVNPTQN